MTMWTYRARLDTRASGVVDGDTVDLVVDLGFHTQQTIRARVRGVDTAEVYGVSKDSDEYEQGQEHSRFVREWFDHARTDYDTEWPLVVVTEKTGKYGRWVADIGRKCDGHDLATDLIDAYPETEDD